MNALEFVVAYYDSGFVFGIVEGGVDSQAGFGGSMTDQFDNRLVTRQRTTPPVFGDETEQSMFDLVPLAGSRREVTNMQWLLC